VKIVQVDKGIQGYAQLITHSVRRKARSHFALGHLHNAADASKLHGHTMRLG
jgi:hypothetical protein